MEKIPYLGERVTKAAQISYGGERIDLVKVIKPAAVFAVAYLRDKKPFCVIVAEELHIHVENFCKLADRQKFFHKTSQVFSGTVD